MTEREARLVLSNIRFRDWVLRLDWEDKAVTTKGDPWLQVQFTAPNIHTGEPSLQKGRKWRISPHMTTSEVVSTAFKAVLAAVEHEAREDFSYCGRRIFGPHIDVQALWEVAERTDGRESVI